MDKAQQRAVVILSGLALKELKDRRPAKAREHLEDIQAVLLGGAEWARTVYLGPPIPRATPSPR